MSLHQHYFRFARLINAYLAVLLGVVVLAFPVTAHSMIAGRADFVVGKVEAVAADGSRRPLAKGSQINVGETINTDANARAQIRFNDGGFVSLQPSSVFRVDEFNYQNKTDGEEKGFFSLLKGGLRAITGAIGRVNRDSYRVTTPIATIGIRGTGYNAMLSDSDGLFVNVGEGVISLTNNTGFLLVSAGGAAFVANINTPPEPTTEHPQTPPAELETVTGDALYIDETSYVIAENLDPSGIPIMLPSLVSGPGYALAYAYMQCGGSVCSGSGSGALIDVNATFNGISQLLQYETKIAGGALGAATVSFSVTDGIIGWGRWDGSTAISPVINGSPPHPLTNGVFHYVIGIPTATMPTSGTATYALIGYTTPTSTDRTTGWQFGGVLTADFASFNVGVNLTTTNLTDTYTISGSMPITGATFNTSGAAQVPLATTFSSTDTAATGCTVTAICSTTINGFFAGDNASHAGLTYDIADPTDPSAIRHIEGAAAFATRAGAAVQQPLPALLLGL